MCVCGGGGENKKCVCACENIKIRYKTTTSCCNQSVQNSLRIIIKHMYCRCTMESLVCQP